MSMYCPECLHPHGRYEACGPAFTSECVICDVLGLRKIEPEREQQ